jgi:ATP-dependent RNA helicase DeaD
MLKYATYELDFPVDAPSTTGKTHGALISTLSMILRNPHTSSDDSAAHPYLPLISPTREGGLSLRRQLDKMIAKTLLRSSAVYGGTTVDHQFREMLKGPEIIVATAGRLARHVREGSIKFDCVKYIIFDDAHGLVAQQTAHRHDILDILNDDEVKRYVAGIIRVVASSVWSHEMRAVIEQTWIRSKHEVVKLAVAWYLEPTYPKTEWILLSMTDKLQPLLEDINTHEPRQGRKYKQLIFTNSIAGLRKRDGGRSHIRLSQTAREAQLRNFVDGTTMTLFSCGTTSSSLEIPGLDRVIHSSLPANELEFVARSSHVKGHGKVLAYFDPLELLDASLKSRIEEYIERFSKPQSTQNSWLRTP